MQNIGRSYSFENSKYLSIVKNIYDKIHPALAVHNHVSIVIIYTENCHPSYLVSNETTPKRSQDSQTRLKYGNMDF